MNNIPEHKKEFYEKTYLTKNWEKVDIEHNKKIQETIGRSNQKELLRAAHSIYDVAQRMEDPKLKTELLKIFDDLVYSAGAYYEVRKDDGRLEFLGF